MSKYKLKSSKSILKRFKLTAGRKFLRHKACRSHLLSKKTAQCKQRLRKVAMLKYADYALLKDRLL